MISSPGDMHDQANLIRPDQQRTVYIAGAGIAGMTLALALAKLNVKTVILEKTRTIQTEGAGIQISPNAYHVLNWLGLSAALQKSGFAPAAIDIYPFKRTKPLISLELGETAKERFGAPYIVIHRADLSNALFKACKHYPSIAFHFDTQDFDMEAHANGLSVCVNQDNGRTHTAHPFAFIGADGVHSPTRIKILSGPKAKYSGFIAWRALIPASMMQGSLNLNHTSLLWGPGFHAVTYPHPKRHVINVALFNKEELINATKTNAVMAPDLPESAISCPRITTILNAAEAGWQKWPLNAVKTSVWHKGAVGLIGDAAHAMLPFQAQGAAMAIEDAIVLAPLLAEETNPQNAFVKYASDRKKRVARVIKTSASNGAIYHMSWPFSLARDAFVVAGGSRAHLKRLAWIYGHDSVSAAITSDRKIQRKSS